MGTSASSRGAPSGVPMVPPWVPDVIPANGGDTDAPGEPADTLPAAAGPRQVIPIAPPGRFGPSRTSLGQYAHSGSSTEMKRGLGHYVGKGLGGAGMAARRFGGTVVTAGALYGALSSAASGNASEPGSPFDPALLAGRTASEIMDAVVEAVRPMDGTQDAEASRQAIRDALAELLNRFPDADLLDLSELERVFAIEQFIAMDVFIRFRLDVGKAMQDKAPSIAAAMARFKEVKNYIKETVAAAFRKVRVAGEALNSRRIMHTVRQALGETFRVFEEYVR